MRYILITGGAGYIGSHTNALLKTLGVQTIVLDNLIYGHKKALDLLPTESKNPTLDFNPSLADFLGAIIGGGGETRI